MCGACVLWNVENVLSSVGGRSAHDTFIAKVFFFFFFPLLRHKNTISIEFLN